MFLSYTHDSSKTKTAYEKMKESVFLPFIKLAWLTHFLLVCCSGVWGLPVTRLKTLKFIDDQLREKFSRFLRVLNVLNFSENILPSIVECSHYL